LAVGGGDHGGNGASWRICRRDYLRLARGAYLAAMARIARLIPEEVV
jgi:hypothetical protein